jgi:hypothetical protein
MKTIITFQNTTQALNGELILQVAGLPVGLRSLPNEIGHDCGFCLTVSKSDLYQALKLLGQAGITWQGTYTEAPGETPYWRKIVSPDFG